MRNLANGKDGSGNKYILKDSIINLMMKYISPPRMSNIFVVSPKRLARIRCIEIKDKTR